MKQKISILGCGWLGMPLAHQLIKLGYTVKGSTTSTKKLSQLQEVGIDSFSIKLEGIPSDISDFLDSEILIIAIPSKNIDGFKDLIPHIEKSPILKVVFISSTSVYAPSNKVLSEESPLKMSPLVEIEQVFRTNTNFQTTILRFAGLIGYNRKPGNFFPEGKKIPNPDGFVNMIHQDDCIGIIEQILKKNVWSDTFNACADTHPTRRKFYTKAKLDLGKDIPEFIENDPLVYKVVSNKKLKKLLGFAFKYPDLLGIN